ncbi:MAG: 3'-5' exonuclease [Promethearchaeota archaeon]
MSNQGRTKTFYQGYRSWFQPFRYNEREKIPIFVLDYETHSQWEDTHDYTSQYEDREYSKTKLINGIQIYFLDEDYKKRKAFLRHEPYYYLLLEDGLSQKEINKVMAQIRQVEDKQVINVEKGDYYDAADLTFLKRKTFLKVTADRPRSVPNLRVKSEEITGVQEWREADVLFHHRCAIDHDVRVGAWYLAEINRGEIINLSPLHNKTPPQLKILAFDIETDFEQTRDPNPNKDEISMISLFTGTENKLLINAGVVETKDVKNFDILLRQKDDATYPKPWVDWKYSKTPKEVIDVIEKFPIEVIIVKTEKELLQLFYQFIDDYRPDVITDFFGGRFDIPFLAIRSEKHKISFEKETGFEIKFRLTRNLSRKDLHQYYSSANIDHVAGAGIIHLDAYLFNEKYSYLPKKDLGLKPSVEKKLKIIPIGREALLNIKSDPVSAVAYSGSDGYITWKYVREIVLDFFISMGQIFPVPASELLTRRAGSLDDLLIDAEDYKHQIIGRRRVGQNDIVSFSPGIVIESLAYTGGLVEAKRPGIWRSDLNYSFKVNKISLRNLKEVIRRVIEKESNILAKKVIKEEFEKHLLAELGEVKVEYAEDPVQFLKEVEVELLRNGIPHQELKRQLDSIRNILEEISSYQPINVEEVTTDILAQIEKLSSLDGITQLKGVHVDVTSMYPSQIRQYKLQPSGIVSLTKCRMCELYEPDDRCFVEGDWVIKLSANRPCRFKDKGAKKCASSVCNAQNEAKCKKYDPIQNGITRSREIFTFDGKKTEAYILINGSKLEKVPVSRTYLGASILKDPFVTLQQWLRNSVEATQLTTKLAENHFDIFEDTQENIQLPSNSFLSLDVRTKKMTILLSVHSRVCQKAYNFVARIMDDFFNTRVRHKIEAKRLSQIISQKYKNQFVPPKLLRQQKFHESTQIGMKVPLNSIYGLLGMKGGVRNASMPCAGITTKLSADLIFWAANQLDQIGLVTELDSLDYNERLILKDPNDLIRVLSIGELTDHCISVNQIHSSDKVRNVDYIVVPKGWQALSVTDRGITEWKPILKCVRQKTSRKLTKIKTPFGSVKTTESHSVFHNLQDRIEPIEVKKLKSEYITHISKIPPIEKKVLFIDFTKFKPPELDLYVFVPVKDNVKSNYPISNIRYDRNSKNKRTDYYKIQFKDFNGNITPDTIVGTEKGYKYPARIKLDENIAELCGWFVAEGSSGVYKDKISVGISQKDEKRLNHIKKIIEDVAIHLLTPFKIKPSLSDSRSNTKRLAMDNIFFYHLFEILGCGHDAFEKRIPKLILSSSNKLKKAFLRGYFGGDGDFQGKRKTFWTSSDGLRDDLFVLGKQLGYIISIQETISSSSGNTSHIINYMDKDNWKAGSRSHYDHLELNDTIGIQNRSLSQENKTSNHVYDLSVLDNNNFVAANGGIVCHNTDGIWLWVPKLFPLEFSVTITNSYREDKFKVFKVSLIDKILNEKVATFSKNDNYWINNGETIIRSSKSLIQFEQDGPYDFQFVMGKKKYIVYNYNQKNQTWIEKELTGLESKRADFSKLQKYFQERIINTFLDQYNPDDPITIDQLYENANREADLIRTEMINGRMDSSYFVKPKAINKPLRAYKSKLPQVSAAYILKDLGYSVDPGTRIQMLNIKGNHVIPRQLLDFDFKTIKRVLVKHAIASLSFMLGELSTKDDLQKLIDVNQYIEDIFGPGRIYDRMIRYPKEFQQLTPQTQRKLDLNELRTVQRQKVRDYDLKLPKKSFKKKRRTMRVKIKNEKQAINIKTFKQKKLGTQSLDNLFQNDKQVNQPESVPIVKRVSDKKITSSKSDIEAKVYHPPSQAVLITTPKGTEGKAQLISSEEIQELETNEIFTNGNNELELDTPKEELMVCSECGALVNPLEITSEGCTFCGGQRLR